MSLLRNIQETMRSKWERAFFGGLTLALWGIWLLLPGITFSESSAWDFMKKVGTENQWGLGMLFASVSALIGMYKRDAIWCRNGMFIVTWAYFFIFSSFASSKWQSTGTPVYFMITVYCFLRFVDYVDMARDQMHAERSQAVTEKKGW